MRNVAQLGSTLLPSRVRLAMWLELLWLGTVIVGCDSPSSDRDRVAIQSVNTGTSSEPASNASTALNSESLPTNEVSMAERQVRAVPDIQHQSDADGHLRSVDLTKCYVEWSKMIELLGKLPKLDTLWIGGKDIDDRVASLVSELSNLRTLRITESRLTDDGVESIGKLAKLRSLQLRLPSLNERGMKCLENLTGLVSFGLQGCRVSDESLRSMAAWPELRELSFYEVSVSGDFLRFVAVPPKLEKLKLSNIESLDEVAMEHLAAFSQLRQLDLSLSPVSDATMKVVGSLRTVEDLNLWRTRISDEGVARLTTLPLRRLNLDDISTISDAALEHVSKLHELEFLHLGKTQITDAGLVSLESLQKLRDLRLNGSRATKSGVERLKAALPDLTKLVF